MSQAALSDPLVLRSLVACASVLALSPSRYVAFGKEVIGSALTVVLVVGSGPLVGVLLGNAAAPYVGEYEGALIMCSSIVLIDRLFGGPKNNPIVSLVLYMWGLSRPLDVLVEISGQLAGGLIGFPILASVCATHGKSMGGPSVDLASTAFSTALISEALASFLLISVIGLLAFTSIGQYYWIKQPAIAVMIRVIATQAYFSVTGPAMNPMLPTTYLVYTNSTWPTDVSSHYMLYWLAAAAGAALAATLLRAVIDVGPRGGGAGGSAASGSKKKKKKA